jgi:hypothetical protein
MATVKHQFDAMAGVPFNANVPELTTIMGTNAPELGWSFDGTSDENVYFRFKASNYGSGSLTLIVDGYSRSGSTSGGVVMGAALQAITPGDAQSMESDAFATETTGSVTINSTAKGPSRISVTISNLDSLAADDLCMIKLGRRPGNGSDTMTGDFHVVFWELTYSDT